MSSEPIHPTPEDLFAYRDGELPAERRTLIEAHVVSCHACRERIDSVSRLEAGLSQRADDVGDDYYARLSESVLRKIGAGAPERAGTRGEESRAAAKAGPAAAASPAEEAAPPTRERRRPDSPVAERPARAPGFPWPALVSTLAAAGAVVVVVVMLFQQGAIRRPWERTVALRAPAESAATAPVTPPTGALEAAGENAPAPSAGPPPGPLPAAEKKAAPPPREPAPALEKGPAVGSDLADRLAARAKEEKAGARIVPAAPQTPLEVARGESKSLVRAATESGAPSPAPAQAPTSPAAGGETPFQSLLRRHDLPGLWEEGRVSARALLGAEPELRALYMTGRAGADSARVRLYLAEAARLAYEARPDSLLYSRIVHHYLRAIRIAGPESDVGRVARERLQSFSR